LWWFSSFCFSAKSDPGPQVCFIAPALFSCYKFGCDEETKAGPSTAFGAKNAPNFAQDDNLIAMQFFGAGSIRLVSKMEAASEL
jgi:hypothetical protein